MFIGCASVTSYVMLYFIMSFAPCVIEVGLAILGLQLRSLVKLASESATWNTDQINPNFFCI